ncbi:hypothetical protein OE88DRAFT_1723197 [Heliocybe sulcata]|uniref:3-hydroxyisobutyryl-CoA hydrolase n=1 Tax=Heliocybe sulcata TaxID=5364 RepID=A0A5C3NAE2_9AGAM|nr:hypothetical protein OE88DRAFT_1723197 [Heliocybe sulcata]
MLASRSCARRLAMPPPSARVGAVLNHLRGMASTAREDDVLFESHLSSRTYILNREKKLNALDETMLNVLRPKIEEWAATDLCKLIIARGAGRAFCAGGDVASVVQQAANPETRAQAVDFFKREFEMDYILAVLGKPYIAIMDGITMGGGAGLCMHAPFRVATERTKFAMPETKIGYCPDVGASAFLARLDGELGTYLALTSEVISGREVYELGLATHYVDSSTLPALLHALQSLEEPSWETIDATIEGFYAEDAQPVPSAFVKTEHGRPQTQAPLNTAGRLALPAGTHTGALRAALDHAFSASSVPGILLVLATLAQPGSSIPGLPPFPSEEMEGVRRWAGRIGKEMRMRSPTSLAVSLEAQRRGRKGVEMEESVGGMRKVLREVLEMELGVATAFVLDSWMMDDGRVQERRSTLVLVPRRQSRDNVVHPRGTVDYPISERAGGPGHRSQLAGDVHCWNAEIEKKYVPACALHLSKLVLELLVLWRPESGGLFLSGKGAARERSLPHPVPIQDALRAFPRLRQYLDPAAPCPPQGMLTSQRWAACYMRRYCGPGVIALLRPVHVRAWGFRNVLDIGNVIAGIHKPEDIFLLSGLWEQWAGGIEGEGGPLADACRRIPLRHDGLGHQRKGPLNATSPPPPNLPSRRGLQANQPGMTSAVARLLLQMRGGIRWALCMSATAQVGQAPENATSRADTSDTPGTGASTKLPHPRSGLVISQPVPLFRSSSRYVLGRCRLAPWRGWCMHQPHFSSMSESGLVLFSQGGSKSPHPSKLLPLVATADHLIMLSYSVVFSGLDILGAVMAPAQWVKRWISNLASRKVARRDRRCSRRLLFVVASSVLKAPNVPLSYRRFILSALPWVTGDSSSGGSSRNGASPDFSTGVRAVLIDKLPKDQRPAWQPSNIDEIKEDDIIKNFFLESSPFFNPKPILETPQESAGQFVDNPNRFALPSEKEIESIIKGSHETSGDFGMTVEELVDKCQRDLAPGSRRSRRVKGGIREKVVDVVRRKCEVEEEGKWTSPALVQSVRWDIYMPTKGRRSSGMSL